MPTESRPPNPRYGGRNAPKFRVGQFVKCRSAYVDLGLIEGRSAGDWFGAWDPKYRYYQLPWQYSVRDDRGVLHRLPEESILHVATKGELEKEKRAILDEIERRKIEEKRR